MENFVRPLTRFSRLPLVLAEPMRRPLLNGGLRGRSQKIMLAKATAFLNDIQMFGVEHGE